MAIRIGSFWRSADKRAPQSLGIRARLLPLSELFGHYKCCAFEPAGGFPAPHIETARIAIAIIAEPTGTKVVTAYQESRFPFLESDDGLLQISAATITASTISRLPQISKVRLSRKPPKVAIKISTAKADVRIAEVRNVFRK